MVLQGRCHCGNISFALTWEPDPVEIAARACDCSFCTRHGGVWTSNPHGSLTVRIREHATPYTFGTGTADFHVCNRCGVVPVVTSRIDGNLYAVVNVNTFEDVAPTLLRRAPSHLGDEDLATRLARRKRNWIASVTFDAR